MNSAKFRLAKLFCFFTTPQDSPSVDFLFVVEGAQNPTIDFLLLERELSKALVEFFYCELPLGNFYRHTCIQDSQTHPQKTFPWQTLSWWVLPRSYTFPTDASPTIHNPYHTVHNGHFPDKTHPQWTLSRPDTWRTDTSPTRRILDGYFSDLKNPDGHLSDQVHPRKILSQPGKCPTDNSLTRCIPQWTFPQMIKYLKWFFADISTQGQIFYKSNVFLRNLRGNFGNICILVRALEI